MHPGEILKDESSRSACNILIGKKEILSCQFAESNHSDAASENQQIVVQKRVRDEILKEMRVRISTVLKTDNVSFLLGAGTSMAAGGISLASIPASLEEKLIEKAKHGHKDAPPGWITLFYDVVSTLTKEDYSYDKRMHNNENKPINLNIEDFLGKLITWQAGMVYEAETLQLSGESVLRISRCELKQLIKEITYSIAELLDLPKCTSQEALLAHKKFIKKILTRPLNLRRVNVFTLNYDTLIEQASDSEGVILVDGFIGTLRRVFRPESYDIDFYFPAQTTEGRVQRFDRAIHFYKLHGSLTWRRCEQNWENPYGIYSTFYKQQSDVDDVLMYPATPQYAQTLGMPYSELFRRFGNAVVQLQSALFVIGYGFGNEHVNAMIRQALAIPSFTLIIVDPDPKSSFVQELKKLGDERVWIISGEGLGTFEKFVDILLPDLKEEEINAKVVASFNRMADVAKKVVEDGNRAK